MLEAPCRSWPSLPVHRLDVLLGHVQVVRVGDHPGAGAHHRQGPLGRTMSPAGCRRLTTMLQSRPRSASSTPGDGRTGTSAPAMPASRSHHGPVALTTRSARISASRPRRCSWTATPVTRAPWRSRPVTSVNGCKAAPLRRALAKNRSGSRMASMVASGTHTVAFSAGLRPGSSWSASAGGQLPGRDVAGGAGGQEPGPVVHVLVGEGDEQAAVLLERPGRDAAQDAA
jgi:hypothetical protein